MELKKLESNNNDMTLFKLFTQIIFSLWIIFGAITISAFVVEKSYIILNIKTITSEQTMIYIILLTIIQWILILILIKKIFYNGD